MQQASVVTATSDERCCSVCFFLVCLLKRTRIGPILLLAFSGRKRVAKQRFAHALTRQQRAARRAHADHAHAVDQRHAAAKPRADARHQRVPGTRHVDDVLHRRRRHADVRAALRGGPHPLLRLRLRRRRPGAGHEAAPLRQLLRRGVVGRARCEVDADSVGSERHNHSQHGGVPKQEAGGGVDGGEAAAADVDTAVLAAERLAHREELEVVGRHDVDAVQVPHDARALRHACGLEERERRRRVLPQRHAHRRLADVRVEAHHRRRAGREGAQHLRRQQVEDPHVRDGRNQPAVLVEDALVRRRADAPRRRAQHGVDVHPALLQPPHQRVAARVGGHGGDHGARQPEPRAALGDVAADAAVLQPRGARLRRVQRVAQRLVRLGRHVAHRAADDDDVDGAAAHAAPRRRAALGLRREREGAGRGGGAEGGVVVVRGGDAFEHNSKPIHCAGRGGGALLLLLLLLWREG
eukprot:Rhum_TRINITY_DN11019_c0_g1::Rhum_TRINITY_DN11019_c0_g1_i1::g.41911::m.41911